MRVLFCIAGLPIGGAERQLLRLMKGMHEHGHQVYLHVFGNHEAVHYKEVYEMPFPVFFSDIKRGVKFRAAFIILRDLRRILNEFKPDLLFGSLHKANMAVRLAKLLRFTNVPVAVTMRTDFEKLYPKGRQLLERAMLPLTDLWISNHKPSSEKMALMIGDRSVYIPNGIDESDLADSSAGETFPPFGGLKILSVGSFYIPYKNHLEMLRAIRIVCDQQPELKLRYRILGKGAHQPQIEAEIQRLALEDCAAILPAAHNVTDYYRDADVLLHGSVIEGCPNVMIEAMMCGVPAIGSAYIGKLDVIEDGISGFVASGDDGQSMSKAILRFAALSPEQRGKMAKAARDRIVRKFSNAVMVQAYEKLFEKTIRENLH